MEEIVLFNLLMWVFGFTSVAIFILLFFVSAPYGQHIRKKWGLNINNKLGWFIMEVPTVLIYVYLYLIGDNPFNVVTITFLCIWLLHYGQRTFIFPFLIRGAQKMPVLIMSFGMIFNGANTYLQARWINTLADPYYIEWLLSPMFIIGIIIFITGFIINLQADHIIRNLREPGETAFKIPYGGMYKYISCPNYLGEITEWVGWSVMTWSFPGLIFVAWTIANLSPRARSNHLWYLETFPDYPKNRKALIPFIY